MQLSTVINSDITDGDYIGLGYISDYRIVDGRDAQF